MSRYINRLSNLSNRAVLFVLIAVALMSSVASLVVNVVNNVDTTPGWWVSWLQNFSTEMFGAFLTFILLTLVVGNRQEKERLIRLMGSTDNATALNAVRELEVHKWLFDGSLRGAYLVEANLKGATLAGANLGGANLSMAELQGTSFSFANLRHTSLSNTDLQRVDFIGANLQGADLSFTMLRGTSFEGGNLQTAKLEDAVFSDNTTLPDGSRWTPETDLARFTDPAHPQFWRSDDPSSPAYREKGEG